MRKKYLLLGLVFAMVLCSIIYINGSKVSAETTQSKTASTQKSFWWTVPNGGHSSATIKLKYSEYYTVSGNNSNFKKRSRCILFQRAGATSLPKYSYVTLKHSTGQTFSKWKEGSLIISSPWNSGSIYYNTVTISYVRTTKVTGTLNATVTCTDGNIPTRAVSVSQRLNTK